MDAELQPSAEKQFKDRTDQQKTTLLDEKDKKSNQWATTGVLKQFQ